jgi:hypothetical protein
VIHRKTLLFPLYQQHVIATFHSCRSRNSAHNSNLYIINVYILGSKTTTSVLKIIQTASKLH